MTEKSIVMKKEAISENRTNSDEMMIGETVYRHSSHSHYRAEQRGCLKVIETTSCFSKRLIFPFCKIRVLLQNEFCRTDLLRQGR